MALAAAIVTLVATADRTPPLEPAALARARERWAAAGPRSYRLSLEMEGSELGRGLYVVEVRDGRVARLTRDGIAATGDASYYTVEGLHRLLDLELDLARDPARSYGAEAGYRAYLFAAFDPERGVPLRFRRVVGGTRGKWAEWKVTSFDPL